MKSTFPEICIFRTDRIGDLILTLPAAEAAKRAIPGARVTMCVQEYTAPLASMSPAVDDVIAIRDRDLDGGVADFVRLLRDRNFDAAVFAYPRPRLAWAAFRAGIRIRSGTAYRWYSRLFTHRVREHRRDSRRHESEYALSLLDRIGIPVRPAPLPRLLLPEGADESGFTRSEILKDAVGGRFIIIHPGSGGSAKDWSPRNFGLLARMLKDRFSDFSIIITGTGTERGLMEEVQRHSKGAARAVPDSATLPEFVRLCSRAGLLAANSTGPLHIAAALGVPVLGFYPFFKPCNPRRWGPLGENTAVLTPPLESGCPTCLRENCEAHDRMDRITVESALFAATKLLKALARNS